MKFLLLCVPFLVAFFNFAQFSFEFSNTPLVIKGSDTLSIPFSGGLNSAQIADFDYDFDGDLDLFIFDRSSDNIRVFIQEEQNGKHFYRFEYNAQTKFPNDLRYRATLVDYNGDGQKDLFTYGVGGVKVYRNIGDKINGLQWELASDLLITDNQGVRLNLYVSSADIPAFVDVEGDGDIDVLTFHISGQHLEYHQNQSVELYGKPDSLIYVLKNACWGRFREDLNANTVYLNDTSSECNSGNVPNAQIPKLNTHQKNNVVSAQKHSGSTILAFDYDNSGVLDLVLGDVAFPNLTLLINSGSAPNTNSAMTSQDNAFPNNSLPVNLQLFPAAFWVDVDFDSKKDLIVCPNARNSPENEKSILFYKNIGSNQLPTFAYQKNNFLQALMIDHGTGSQPILCDIDNDGLKDLFIANFYRYIPTLNKESCLAYYKNVGTATTPKYRYIDFNFLDLNTSGLGLKLSPAFGDIDNDGDADLYIGREDGTLTFFENISSSQNILFASPQSLIKDVNGTSINVGQAANPQLFDLNNDGLLDLVIGRKTGELTYYQNTGSSTKPAFKLITEMLGGVDVAPTSGNGYAAPHFFRHDDTTYLFLGAADGKLHFYDNIDGNLVHGKLFNLKSSNYLSIDAGAYSSFWVDDIDTDGNLNLFVGQDLGGLYHFEVDPKSNASTTSLKPLFEWVVYPNPTVNEIHITWETSVEVSNISILDVKGQVISHFQATNATGSTLEVPNLSKGLYFVELTTTKGTYIKRISKL